MAGEIKLPIHEILTSAEVKSIVDLQNAYSGLAKEAAFAVADAVELEPVAKEQFVAGITDRLEDMDFEQRKEVTERLRGLHVSLGQSATSSITKPELSLVSPPKQRNERNNRPRTAVKWLQRVYKDEDVARITSLEPDQKDQFAEQLASKYCSLKITRLNPEAKRQRAQQLVQFLAGHSYQEIATAHAASEPAIQMAIKKMANSITSRVTYEDLQALIPDTDNSSSKLPHEDYGSQEH
jgi:hypothetical protein